MDEKHDEPAPSIAETTNNSNQQPGNTPKISLVAQHELNKTTESSTEAQCRRFYSSTQWSADGTCIVATSSDQRVSTFVLPSDLLDDSNGKPKELLPQANIKLPEPAQTVRAAPYFSLAEPASQILLAGCRDHPLQLYRALPTNNDEITPIATYKLIRKETEQYITPSSILWELPGSHFLCGSANRLDYFDISRYGADGPILTIPTIPSKRHISKGGGVGMKGTVSCLSAAANLENSIVAAGTWTRWMGLYDLQRSEKSVAHWSIAEADQKEFDLNLGGQGIIQTLWSPCGRYLVVNERRASGLLVYDIRGTGRLLSILNGRLASTQQKLTGDVFQATDSTGFEVWAGSDNGTVSVWQDVGMTYSVAEPSWTWPAATHATPVGSTIMHPSGTVAATCSGAWQHASDDHVEAKFGGPCAKPDPLAHLDIRHESGLKVWKIDQP